MHILVSLFAKKKGSDFLERISENISIIDTEALGEPRVVAAYLVSGKERALIDMGYRSSAETVLKYLIEQGIGSNDLDYLLPTHVHLDHCGSCGTLAKRFPSATVRVHPIGEVHLSDTTRLVKSARELFGDDLMRKYGSPDPIEKKRIRGVADDEEIDVGGGLTLRAIWTPGHASHHLSYLLEGTGIIFTGDALGVHYPDFPILVPTTPPPSFHLEKAVASLERIRALSPSRFCTPHFGILNSAKDWIDENIHALLDWKKTLEPLIAAGCSEDEIERTLTDGVCQRAKRPPSQMPEHLRILIRVDILGVVRYLKTK